MNKHELYGVKMVHPVDCMTPSFVSTLPHETGEAVYLMSSRAEAHSYAQMCGMGRKSMTATQTPFGPNMNSKAVMPAVAIVYKVDCPDDVYRALKTENIQGAPVKYGSLEGMQLHPIEAYVQADSLHGACPYSLYEIGAEMAARWNDYREFNIALENSTPDQLRLLDFSNPSIQASLQLMYGEAGRINTDFFNSHSNADHLMSIERVMYKGHVGVGYMMNLLELENKYQETYHTLTAEGYSRDYAAATAAKETVQALQMLSGLYGDTKADKETFTPLVEAYSAEKPAREDPIIPEEEYESPFVEPTTDEGEITV